MKISSNMSENQHIDSLRKDIENILEEEFVDPSFIDGFRYMGDFSELNKCQFLSFPDGSMVKNGIEAKAVFRSNDNFHVIKVLRMQDGVRSRINKLIDHNKLFGNKTAYAILGAATCPALAEAKMNGLFLVVRQPYVEFVNGSGPCAREKLKADMKRRFGRVRMRNLDDNTTDWFIGKPEFHLDDLKDANIGIDRTTGDYAVVDCIIHRGDPFGWWDKAFEV